MFRVINGRIILSIVMLITAAVLIIGATSAFFSDTETSQDNNFTSGSIDLKIDNRSYLNGVLDNATTWTLNDLTNQLFFNFSDVKPGDLGEDTVSFLAENDYWLCANLKLTANDDNTCTESEELDDPTCSEPNTNLFDGELAQNINFVFWADDGDNVLETGEKIIREGTAQDVLDNSIVLADSKTNNLGKPDGIPAPGGINSYVGEAWCFGKLMLNPVPADTGVNPTVNGGVACDGTLLNNATQTDKVLADIQFDAIQARNNLNFICSAPTPTPIPTTTPVPTPAISCESSAAIYASSFSHNDQGRRKNGTTILVTRSNPSAAFGLPQTLGNPFDTIIEGSFFSLGFPNISPSTASASIVFGFDKPFYNGPGNDLQIFEVTGGPPYSNENVRVEVSMSPDGPWTLLIASSLRDTTLNMDLGPITKAQYVRLTDVSDITPFEATADGYDVDAVKAFCTEVEK
jgi:predicted ribosomally synthesized peptide with SipW-like signal peptide